MSLPLEQIWEFFEFTVLKRTEDFTLTDAVTVHLYDDDRDMFLSIKGHQERAVQQTIDAIKKSLQIEPFEFDQQEEGSLNFYINGNPPQTELRSAMLATIERLQSVGFRLRSLEDTWV
ncbi:hypothetical protein AAUI01_04975 [Pseudomonas mosselii]|uniref:hypothetical protein n=1 Tax=Pseudomonas mosselii TaxID=78327 RepID=UPI0032E3ACBC